MSLGESQNQCIDTVDVERFAELNVHGFNPTEVFTEILLHFLGTSPYKKSRNIFKIFLNTCTVAII